MEEAQKCEQDFIPKKGDQKTGLIGEAFVFQYLRSKGYKQLSFGNTSTTVWDIFGVYANKKEHIQVKTVSGFSETRIMSPIHKGWDKLYLVSLDKKFMPNGLWLIEKEAELDWSSKKKYKG